MKIIENVLLGIVTVYAGVFLIWAMLFSACEDRTPDQCGGDMLSQTVRVVYRPVMVALAGNE